MLPQIIKKILKTKENILGHCSVPIFRKSTKSPYTHPRSIVQILAIKSFKYCYLIFSSSPDNSCSRATWCRSCQRTVGHLSRFPVITSGQTHEKCAGLPDDSRAARCGVPVVYGPLDPTSRDRIPLTTVAFLRRVPCGELTICRLHQRRQRRCTRRRVASVWKIWRFDSRRICGLTLRVPLEKLHREVFSWGISK